MNALLGGAPLWLSSVLIAAGALLAALLLHRIGMAILRRAAVRSQSGTMGVLLDHLCRPGRWILVLILLQLVQPALRLDADALSMWRRVMGLAGPAVLGWFAVGLLNAINRVVQDHADISVADNLRARRRRTRAGILHRIALAIVLLISFCLMLMSIPSIRSIGVTVIASAGLVALAVGAAAQPALKNLIAGLQMAFTEPIRIDDVVIIDGEWGRIEEIRLTFVVVRIWDDRRLVVPVSRFLEQSFQNWTRETSQLLGSVFWYLDPATDIARLRAHLAEVVKASERWDGRFFNMQVTDVKADAIEVRALMTAKDASTAFDLRCEVREAMLAHMRDHMPDAFPRRREDVRVQPSTGSEAGSAAEGGAMAAG